MLLLTTKPDVEDVGGVADDENDDMGIEGLAASVVTAVDGVLLILI